MKAETGLGDWGVDMIWLYLLRYTITGWSRIPLFTAPGEIKHFINAVSASTAEDHTLQKAKTKNQ